MSQNKSVVEWFRSKPYDDSSRDMDMGPPRDGWNWLDRLAELVHVNGGPNVRGWGFISSGNRLYGRFGLEQNEAMSLMSQWAFATGWCEGQPEPKEAFDELAKAIDETWKAREASLPPEPAPVEQPT